MKVLFITYPMAFHTPGGGEIQLLAYKKHLEQKGIQVDLFDPWNPNFLDYDIVHYFSCVGGSIHICNFIKQLGIPLIITSSLWITEQTKHLYPIDEIRAQLNLANAIVTNSNMESDKLSSVLDINRGKFFAVYNGVDDVFYEKPEPNLFRDKFFIYAKFILNVGNIESRKNQINLLLAMHEIPDYKLVLIGNIRDKAYYNNLLEMDINDQVIFIEALKHESPILRSAYQACDVFCLPSTLETPGLSALEALVQGAKCVVTSEGSTKEYFEGEAYYCNWERSDDIAKQIQLAIDNPKLKLGKLNNVLSWSLAIDSLVSIYNSVK
jgi:glycosyltransferase involved in cell wall biosynthesis